MFEIKSAAVERIGAFVDKVFCNAVNVLSINIKQLLLSLPEKLQKKVQEIRLRINQPLVISFGKDNVFLCKTGIVLDVPNCNAYICDKNDLIECFKCICEFSIYTYQNQINQGFITIRGGHRIGLCGSAVIENGNIINIKNISSMNIRIAREFKDCSTDITDYFSNREIDNTVVVGPPSSGKTTMLRDIAYRLSSGKLLKPLKVCIVDERLEICATWSGQPAFDMGFMCDCMSGYPKAQGILTAIRSLSPEVIIFDEIGSLAELQAVNDGFNAGVFIITSVHALGIDDFLKRTICKQLLSSEIFKHFVFLSSTAGKIDNIFDRNELIDKIHRNSDN